MNININCWGFSWVNFAWCFDQKHIGHVSQQSILPVQDIVKQPKPTHKTLTHHFTGSISVFGLICCIYVMWLVLCLQIVRWFGVTFWFALPNQEQHYIYYFPSCTTKEKQNVYSFVFIVFCCIPSLFSLSQAKLQVDLPSNSIARYLWSCESFLSFVI